MSARRGAFALAVAALVLTACGDDPPAAAPSRAVDEFRGRLGAAGIGDDKAAVRRAFGDYGSHPHAYPSEPLEFGDKQASGGPYSVVTGPFDLTPPRPGSKQALPEQLTLRYRGAAFYVLDDRVTGFIVTDRRARTRRGVQVGEPLSVARKAYRSLHCEGAYRGDTTAEQAASCRGKVGAHRFIWFGDDPIRSITVLDSPFF